ncbi:TetR/AcrR family transcriptional regulator [Gaoshiqia sediminis]|uniref:TetR/AcrR family transcriptional regulator n=1 Tax=Gaoshiqia sediminis TaxID=2986998 RepID=A0AA42C689_9BACT|nr:TetR/AcrR family transcriptional regulator [Gaoshiqia sediminis]MCW0482284.1 TetR/AcrR family transcriptional regulator [Gaoshiqia sediminis]
MRVLVKKDERILDSAIVIFFQKGFAGATLSEIAQHANVSKSSIHYYYRSKESLFKTVMDKIIDIIFENVEAISQGNTNLFDLIDEFVSQTLNVFTIHPHLPSFILNGLNTNQQVSSIISELSEIFISKFEKEIILAEDKGLINPIDPKYLFTSILSLSAFSIINNQFYYQDSQNQPDVDSNLENQKYLISSFIVHSLLKQEKSVSML